MSRKVTKRFRGNALVIVMASLCSMLPSLAHAQFAGSFSFGGAASGRTARVVFDNPAGMVRFEEQEYLLGSFSVETNVDFEGSSFRYVGPRVEGGSSSSTVNTGVNAFYVGPMKGKWSFGFGIFTIPAGRDIQYDRLLAHITKEKFYAWNFGPAFAYKVTEKFSIGASLNIEYADFWCNMRLPEFDSEGNLEDGLPGFLTTYGDDWEIGYRLGLLYQFSEDTRLGFSYFSKMEHDLEGYSTYASDTIPDRKGDGYTLTFPIPPFAMLSAHHNFNDQWAVVGTVDYTWWEPYWESTLLDGLVARPPFTSIGGPLNMQNTWGWALGVEFDPSNSWAFVAQYGDEDGPSVDDYRSIKDYLNGHSTLMVAARKYITEQFWIDIGYAYTDGNDAPLTGVPGGQGSGTGEFGLLTWDTHTIGIFFSASPKKKSNGA
jgi:long-chain fatty acid transport protein